MLSYLFVASTHHFYLWLALRHCYCNYIHTNNTTTNHIDPPSHHSNDGCLSVCPSVGQTDGWMDWESRCESMIAPQCVALLSTDHPCLPSFLYSFLSISFFISSHFFSFLIASMQSSLFPCHAQFNSHQCPYFVLRIFTAFHFIALRCVDFILCIHYQ